ncbi:MAG: sigma factor-like helix-turn-helix DNA-binding protein, partial [Planctomycetota bacterium]
RLDAGSQVSRDVAEDSLASQEQVERLRVAIASLPEGQAEVVIRRLDREQSFAEIAEELELPLGTVLSRMRLAMAKLRKQIQE